MVVVVVLAAGGGVRAGEEHEDGGGGGGERAEEKIHKNQRDCSQQNPRPSWSSTLPRSLSQAAR